MNISEMNMMVMQTTVSFIIFIQLRRGEICVANLKAPLQMVRVWVVNKSEKKLKFNLNGGHFYDDMGQLYKNGLLPNGPK